ncbi:hypothetical protein GGS20DRAFT_416383 [Poronia punctata]|nr:hypothetical protein GGS20DRAFT_416383 [Poronia punctata]
MATDVLDSVIGNVPDWLRRLDDLSGQIERRQQDLAKFASSQPQSSAQSIRNRGSAETLKPKEEDTPLPNCVESPVPETADPAPKPIISNERPATPKRHEPCDGPRPPSPPASKPKSGSVARHANEQVATAQRRARATVRKRQKTESMMTSEETAKPQYRTRGMVVVYYDSYVQSFFEELVKFVSSQRSLIRKARMAEKVAQIRRLAELEMPEAEDEDDNAKSNNDLKAGGRLMAPRPLAPALSALGGPDERRPHYIGSRPLGGFGRSPAFMATRSMRTSALNGGLGLFNEKADVWDELDKGLEYVQGICEHAAHQFLRDGDCNEEIDKIKTRLAEVKRSAINEQERAEAKKEAEEIKSLANDAKIQPICISRGEKIHPSPLGTEIQPLPVLDAALDRALGKIGPDLKRADVQPASPGGGIVDSELTKCRTFRPATVRMGTGASIPSKFPARNNIEIDEGIDVDLDDFKPVYRSTRLMRRPV